MKLYFAGATGNDIALLKLFGAQRFLISYFYINQKLLDLHSDTKDLFIDSGAFSAFTQKKEINLTNYISFLREKQYETYAGLDVIRDPEKSLININIMKSHNLNPIATFHKRSDIKYLYEVIENNDYIALGGLAGIDKSKSKNHHWLDSVFKIITTEKPSLKVHGFACTSLSIMKEYPWYSVDSSTWNVAHKFGESYDENGYRVKKKDLINLFNEEKKHLRFFLEFKEFLVYKCVSTMLKMETNSTGTSKDFHSQQTLFVD